MKNWEEDDDDEYCSSRQDFVDAAQRRRRDRHRDRARQLRRRVQGPRVRRVPARVPGRPHAEPRRAVQRRDQVQGLPRPRGRGSAPRRSRPATTRGCARRRADASSCSRASTGEGPELLPAPAEPGAAGADAVPDRRAARRPRCAASPPRSACRTRRRRTRPASASSASGRSASSSTATSPTTPGPIEGRPRPHGRRARRPVVLHARPAQGHRHRRREGARRGARRQRRTRPGSSPARTSAANTLYVVQGHDHPWLLSDALVADDASWVAGAPPAPGRYAAKTRYRQADAACLLVAVAGADGALALALRRAAVGGDAGAVGGALRRRGLPRRRGDRLGGADRAGTGRGLTR